MKGMKLLIKILIGAVALIAVLLIAGVLAIVIQNQKPQVKLGVVEGKFYELNDKPKWSIDTKQLLRISV
jgi:hypothetical protein